MAVDGWRTGERELGQSGSAAAGGSARLGASFSGRRSLGARANLIL